MNEQKKFRWDFWTTAVLFLVGAVWFVRDFLDEPKFPFEPIIVFLSYLFLLTGYYIFRNKPSEEGETTASNQSAHKIWNIGKIKTANFSIYVKGGYIMALVGLLAIGIWQKNEIKDLLGFNRFFRAKDHNFKILVLPFKQICNQNGKNYDAGFVVTERLNGIIDKEHLKIKTHYWESYDFKDFNDETAKALRAYHNADMILFGAYQTDACSGDGSQICINYITDEKWNMGALGNNLSRDYQKGGLDELKTGKLQEKIENLAIFIALVAQIKSLNHAEYLKKLQTILNNEDFSRGSQAAIYIEIADKLREEGKLGELLIQYDKALNIYMSNNDKSNVALCYERLGSTHTALGNLDKALAFYEEGLKLTKELYAAYPNNVDFKKGLAISYSKLGNTHTALGNLEKALGFYEEYNRLGKELYAAYPNNVDFKNGLAISYSKLGNTHTALGNLEKALELYEERNRLGKELHAAYPNNVDFKNGLAISYSKLGETHTSLGNLDKALAFYEEGLKLTKELYAAYPNNVDFKNGLAISYSKLGETHTSLGNLDKALVLYEEDIKLTKELYAAYPNNVKFKNGLAIAYSKLGETHTALGNLEKALGLYEEEVKLSEELYTAYPNNVEFKNGLAISYSQLGCFFRDNKNDNQKARIYFEQCQTLWLELATSFPSYVAFQNNLAWVKNALEDLEK